MTSLRIDPLSVEKVFDLVREWEEKVDLGNHWKPEDWELEERELYLEWSPGRYQYKCEEGHKEKVERDSELALRCIRSDEPLIEIRSEDCPKCLEEDRVHEANGGSFYECPTGHIGRVKFGSELDQYCEANHIFWAVVQSEDCPKCQKEEARRRCEYYEYDMDIDFGPYDEL